MYPNSLKNLVESFKFLPGVGEKTAERMAFSVMDLTEEKSNFFINSIVDIRNKIKKCDICNSLTENNICDICSSKLRDNSVLCVVEDPKSVFLFEKLAIFNGLYHVLNGLISPLEGINPEDIELDKLIDRVRKGNFKEIILAFKPSIESETTALYIKKIIGDLDLVITKIASGIPMGADIEYIDAMTLERALSDRKNIE